MPCKVLYKKNHLGLKPSHGCVPLLLAKRLDGWQERQTERNDDIADFKDRSGWAMDELTERQKLILLNCRTFILYLEGYFFI